MNQVEREQVKEREIERVVCAFRRRDGSKRRLKLEISSSTSEENKIMKKKKKKKQETKRKRKKTAIMFGSIYFRK